MAELDDIVLLYSLVISERFGDGSGALVVVGICWYIIDMMMIRLLRSRMKLNVTCSSPT